MYEGGLGSQNESFWPTFFCAAKTANRRLGDQPSPADCAPRRRLGLAAPGGGRRSGWLIGGKAAIAARACAVKHRELAAEFLQHDLGGVFLLPRLIGPFARLQRAFEVNLGALFQVLLDDLDQSVVEHDDAVPFGAFLALAGGLVAPGFGGRDRHVGDAGAVIGRTNLGVPAEIADQDHLVDASSHRPLLPAFRRLVNRGASAHLWASGAVWQASAA